MINSWSFVKAMWGLRLLLRMETYAFSFFEKDYSGFVRSFFPALLLAPFHFVHVVLAYGAMDEKPDLLPHFTVELLAYVLTWTIFPFVMIYVARSLGRDERYFTYMVPYNWFQMIVGLVVAPITLLVDLEFVSSDGATFFNFLLLGAMLTYGTFMARNALGVATSTAIGIVLMDTLLSLLNSEIIARFYR